MQAAHVVLEVGADNHDDGTRAEEEQGLEHGVGEQVEHGSHVTDAALALQRRDDAKGHEHVSYLRDSGERETALDVALAASHRGSVERGEGRDVSHVVQRVWRVLNPDRHQRRHLVNTGHDHGGGVDESRHWRRAFHGIGKPDVQREHGRLTGTANEHQEQ